MHHGGTETLRKKEIEVAEHFKSHLKFSRISSEDGNSQTKVPKGTGMMWINTFSAHGITLAKKKSVNEAGQAMFLAYSKLSATQ